MIPFDEALRLLDKESDPVSKIVSSSAYWIPLQWLYVELCKNKDLEQISYLPKDEKLRLWALVDAEWKNWKKISVIQAIYVYEKIKSGLQ